MEAKTIEIRDSMTFIPALAMRLNPNSEGDRYLFARAGYGTQPHQQAEYVLLIKLGDSLAVNHAPHAWSDRTMRFAHLFVSENWSKVKSGDVVDVQYLLGETSTPKKSECR